MFKKRRPSWAHDIIREEEWYGAPEGNKRQRIYSNYVTFNGKPCWWITHMFWRSFKEEGMDEGHDQRIPIYNKEWCLRCGANTKVQVNSFFKMDFQDKAFNKWQYWKFQSNICHMRIFTKKKGIDYEETFAPVSRYTFIITSLSLSAKMKWNLHQMYAKKTFLNGVIEE